MTKGKAGDVDQTHRPRCNYVTVRIASVLCALLLHHKRGHRLPLWAGVMTDLSSGSSGSPLQTVQPWAYVGYVSVVICTKNITGEETEQEEGMA